MDVSAVRERARQFNRRTQRWNTFTLVLFPVMIAANAFQIWWHLGEVVNQAGNALQIAALLYVGYWFYRTGGLGATTPGQSHEPCLDAYRRQLIAQRDLGAAPWRWMLPFVPGVGLGLLGRAGERSPVQVAALIAVGVALFAGIALFNAWSARRLQRELDLLVE